MLSSTDVTSVVFATTKFREGYDHADVDTFLAQARSAIESWERGVTTPLRAVDVVNARFQPTKFRQGYDQDQVDDFLDSVVETLRYYESR